MERAAVRPSRIAFLLLVATLNTACGGASGPGASTRISSPATIAVVFPTPSTVAPTGELVARVAVTGGTVVEMNMNDPIRGDRGHVHLVLDGVTVAMAYSTTSTIEVPTKGLHTLEAEFVATDHKSFSPRVVTAVVFRST